MSEPTCGNCKNYRPCTEVEMVVMRKSVGREDCVHPLGLCRGALPKLGVEGDPFGKFPVVYSDGWCAHHKRRRNSRAPNIPDFHPPG